MIILELSEDLGSRNQVVYWLGTTSVTGKDEEHTDEIYQQLDAELIFNL